MNFLQSLRLHLAVLFLACVMVSLVAFFVFEAATVLVGALYFGLTVWLGV